MSRSRMLALAATVSMTVAAFGAAPVAAQDEAPQPPTATPNPVPAEVPAGDGTGVRISTELGDIVIGLYNESAPVASQNFQNLVESGYYDGTGFHRVVRDFVIQGGDPDGNGTGGPGYTIPDEQVVGEYGRGTVAMARTQAPNSQGSQFFVVLDDGARPALESANTYVIFGTVLEGMDVVDAIAERGPEADAIEDQVRIEAAAVEEIELPPAPTPQPPSVAELAAIALLERIPSQVGSMTMDRETIPNDRFLAGAATDVQMQALADVVEANGARVEDLAVVIGGADAGEEFATALGASIEGVPGSELQAPLIGLVLGEIEDSGVGTATIGDTEVTTIVASSDSSPRDTVYIISNDDAVWFVLGDSASVEALIDALG